MDGTGIVRRFRQRLFEKTHGPGDAGVLGLAVFIPPLVGLEHPGVSRDGGDRDIRRIAAGDPIHGLGEATVAGFPDTAVALDQGVDHLTLHRCGAPGQPTGIARGPQGGGLAVVVVAPAVQIGAERPGLAPGAHATAGVQQPRLAEGPHRFLVLKGPAQPDAVIEPGLGFRNGRIDLKASGSEALDHHHVGERRPRIGRNGGATDLRSLDPVKHGPFGGRVSNSDGSNERNRQGNASQQD